MPDLSSLPRPPARLDGDLRMSEKTPFELMMTQAQEMAQMFNPALENFSPKEYEKLWPTMPKELSASGP